jgi:predicted DCC family thiol-disulfide oxidoreductase YuxK
MYTEITDTSVTTVYFDMDCGLCAHWAGRAARLLPADRFRFMPLSSLDPPSSRDEMVLELPGGRRLGGADAAVALAREIRWLLPISVLGRFPRVMPLLRCFYRIVAANRYRITRACRYPAPGGVGARRRS